MTRYRVLAPLFSLMVAGAFLFSGMALAQSDDDDDVDVEEEEDVDDDDDVDVEDEEESDFEEEEEEDVDEDYEEDVDDDEDEDYDEDEEEDVDDDEDDEDPPDVEKPKKDRGPLTEFPPIGIPLVEGKWIDLHFTGAVVALYRMNLTGLTSDPDLHHSFDIHHALMGFHGTFWEDRLEFEVLGDMAEWINPNEYFYDSSFLLDAFVTVNPLRGLVADELSGLSIRIGRFAPGFTHYGPAYEPMIDTVDLPAVTSGFYPGRQMGLEVEYDHDFFAVAVGVFNGMRYQPDLMGGSSIWLGPGFRGATLGNVTDDNKGKDLMVRLTGKVPFGLRIDGFLYMSRPEYTDAATGTHAVAPAFVYGGELKYENIFSDYIRLRLIANFTGRSTIYPDDAAGDPIHPNLTQYGFLFHAGIKIGQWVEPMVRVDFWNGRASDFGSPGVFTGQDAFGAQVPGMATGDTWEMWITGGLNGFLFGDHFRLTLTGTYVSRANEALRDDFWLSLQAAAII